MSKNLLVLNEKLWPEYVAKHQGTHGYAHFDGRCDLADEWVQELLLNPEAVISHGFFPFLRFIKITRKVSKVAGQLTGKVKERPISYSAHLDRCIYQRYGFILNQYYNRFAAEHDLDKVAIAYRDNLHKPPAFFAVEAFKAMEELGRCFVMVGDFTSFFDHIDHRYLKRRLCQLLEVQGLPDDLYAVFKSLTHYASCRIQDVMAVKGLIGSEEQGRKILDKQKKIVTKDEFHRLVGRFVKNPHAYGIPQGSPLCDVLANIYMLEYDLQFHSYAKALGGRYMRYCDDTIMILPLKDGHTVEEYCEHIQQMLEPFIGLVELELNKTKQFVYEEGNIQPLVEVAPAFIDYLGLRLYPTGIALRPRCLTKYYYRMRRKARGIRNWYHNPHRKGMLSYSKMYRIYGKAPYYGAGKKQRNFMSYVEMVDRLAGLSKDREAVKLLRGGAKRKIRKAINREIKEKS